MSVDAHAVVVGAGTAGLVTTLALARRAIDTMLIERRHAPNRHPRALALGASSVALLRGLGVDADESTPEHALGLRVLDAIRASRLEVRFDTGFEAALPVTVDERPAMRLRLSTAGGERHVTGRFLVGADGARSHVRDVAGASIVGTPRHDRIASVWFEADVPPAFRRALVASDAPRRWLLRVPLAEGPRPRGDDAIALVRAAIGLPDLTVDVLDVLAWEARGLWSSAIAGSCAVLVGDAARLLAPSRSAAVDLAIGDAIAAADAIALDRLDRYATDRGALGA